MAAYQKFDSFVEALAEKVHNLGADQLRVALSNSAPTASNSLLSQISQVSYANCSSRALTTASSAQTSGTYALVLNDLTLTASGGQVGPFRYVILYNDTAANDELIAWYDYGSSITLNDGDTFTIDFGASLLTLA
jgi:hypothetical protein